VTHSKILRKFVDESKDFAVVFEQAIHYSSSTPKCERDTLLFPRANSALRAVVRKESFEVSSRQCLWVPKGSSLQTEGITALYDGLTISLGKPLVKQAIEENSLNKSKGPSLDSPFLVGLTEWLQTVRERYVYEKIINLNPPSHCTFYLEKQLINGVFQIAYQTPKELREETQSLTQVDIDRALRFMEKNILEPLTLDQISHYAKVSPRTLTRKFQQKLGLTPMAYLQGRKLEQCKALLQYGDYLINDLALMAGYSDAVAFTRAFRKKFGISPSSLKKKS
jgi:AraC-like DNA-binding protein